MALNEVERNDIFLQTKRRGNSTYQDRGTGIPCNDKRGHARVVSLSAYHLVAKIYQFSIKRFKAMTSNIIKRRIAILVIIMANI